MLLVGSFASEDLLKLMLLMLIGGGLVALGRWSSQLGGRQIGDALANQPTPDVDGLIPVDERKPKIWPPSAEQVAASLPFDPALGKLRIRKFYFDKTDVVPGPADPEVFADDLHLELYDPDSNHAWWQSYFVATPQGLARVLREKSWRYLHAPDILVFPRYNLEEIRRAVVSQIVAEHDHFKGMKQEQEESL